MRVEKRLVFLVFAVVGCAVVAVLLMQTSPQPKALLNVPPNSPEEQDLSDRIDLAIDRGLDFLYKNQLESGEFRAYKCNESSMQNCEFDSSLFVTTLVVYSIKGIHNSNIKPMVNKALSFLLSEKRTNGLWAYPTSKNMNYLDMRADVDDTAMAAYLLNSIGPGASENKSAMLNNTDEGGLFLTWFGEGENVVDCAVNANALLYLGENYEPVCKYLKNALTMNEPCSTYYPKRLAALYMLSRAFQNNVSCAGDNKENLTREILGMQRADGSFGDDLNTSLAIDILRDFGYSGEEITAGIKYLVQNQSQEGSWDESVMYEYYSELSYYGSEELTTALAIEALWKYRSLGATANLYEAHY